MRNIQRDLKAICKILPQGEDCLRYISYYPEDCWNRQDRPWKQCKAETRKKLDEFLEQIHNEAKLNASGVDWRAQANAEAAKRIEEANKIEAERIAEIRKKETEAQRIQAGKEKRRKEEQAARAAALKIIEEKRASAVANRLPLRTYDLADNDVASHWKSIYRKVHFSDRKRVLDNGWASHSPTSSIVPDAQILIAGFLPFFNWHRCGPKEIEVEYYLLGFIAGKNKDDVIVGFSCPYESDYEFEVLLSAVRVGDKYRYDTTLSRYKKAINDPLE